MGHHSLQEAQQQGYLAMQFNMVVSTNSTAVRLWERLGFERIGTVPKCYRLGEPGKETLVDAFVMHRFL